MKQTSEQILDKINDAGFIELFNLHIAKDPLLAYGDITMQEAFQKFILIKEILNTAIKNATFDSLPLNRRNTILSNIDALKTYINNPAQVILQVDTLYDSILGNDLIVQQFKRRDYIQEFKEIAGLKDKLANLANEITEKQAKVKEVDEILDAIKSKKERIETIEVKTEAINENLKERESNIMEIQSSIVNAETAVHIAEGQIEAKKLSINTFSENIEEYKITISELENKAKVIISKESKINELIHQAEIALNLKSAEGISAAFSAQYVNASNPLTLRMWIGGSIAFILIAILLTIWIVSGEWIKDPTSLSSIVGRIVAVGIAVTGSTFCANQYTKQKNISEDYAYKAVLSKSIVAFTDEIKKRDDLKVAEYLEKVLNEIHKDPLRKREEKDEVNISGKPLAMLEKLIEKFPGK